MFSNKLIITIFAITTLSYGSYAQTGIGTRTPDASTILELNATDKGFLLPRVTLTSKTDATTIASPATGLMIYNLGGAVAKGIYWNTGTPSAPEWASPVLISPTVGSVVNKLIYISSTGADGTQTVTSGRFEFRFRVLTGGFGVILPEFRLTQDPGASVNATYHSGQFFGGFSYQNRTRTFTSANYTTWQNISNDANDGLSATERNEVWLTYPGDNLIWQINFVVLDSGGGNLVYAILVQRF